jgi:hypothetical protein
MAEHLQGQPSADRAVGRPGPAARMSDTQTQRRRPSVLIAPVTRTGSAPAPTAPSAAPAAGPAEAAPVADRSTPPTPPGPSQAPPSASQAPPSAPQTPPPPAAAPKPQTQAARVARSAVQPTSGARSARLYLTHVDPWSVMKQAFLLSMALAVIILAASATLWIALESAGVIDAITRTATDVGGDSAASVTSYLSLGKVMGGSLVLAGIETVLVTALATLFAFLYNLAVGIGGGLEITLSEED